MNLKDYAQYYIGCRCLNTWFQANHSSYNAGWKLTGFVATEPKPYHLETDTEYNWTDSIKLILRKLGDVTTDEWSELEMQTSIIPDVYGLNTFYGNFIKDLPVLRLGWPLVNEMLILLRKNGVDVDGLIEAGLAVDIKTLPK